MEAQDQLERNYMSKKEEHRALEMQNYMGLTRNTGTFDPNRWRRHFLYWFPSVKSACINKHVHVCLDVSVCRLMEGDIFRIGMLLDNVKEMIDRNMCELMSPPLSSSTPTPTQEIEVVRLCPFSTQTPSPPPSFHQVNTLVCVCVCVCGGGCLTLTNHNLIVPGYVCRFFWLKLRDGDTGGECNGRGCRGGQWVAWRRRSGTKKRECEPHHPL